MSAMGMERKLGDTPAFRSLGRPPSLWLNPVHFTPGIVVSQYWGQSSCMKKAGAPGAALALYARSVPQPAQEGQHPALCS